MWCKVFEFYCRNIQYVRIIVNTRDSSKILIFWLSLAFRTHRFSIKFRSGKVPGHSRHDIVLSWKYLINQFLLRFGSVSCSEGHHELFQGPRYGFKIKKYQKNHRELAISRPTLFKNVIRQRRGIFSIKTI